MRTPPPGHTKAKGGGVFLRFALLIVTAAALGGVMRRIVFLRRCGWWGAGKRLYRRAAWTLGLTAYAAMAVQELILLAAGLLNWRTGLPLHLCSMAGLLTLPMLLSGRRALWHLSLYAGVPGALAALLFPAVLQTPWPHTTALAFHLMHCMVVLAPFLPLALGRTPSPWGAASAFVLLALAACLAGGVNALTGGNYLFLHGPVAGTPLEALARGGLWPYRLRLAGLCAALLAAEGALTALITRFRHCGEHHGLL